MSETIRHLGAAPGESPREERKSTLDLISDTRDTIVRYGQAVEQNSLDLELHTELRRNLESILARLAPQSIAQGELWTIASTEDDQPLLSKYELIYTTLIGYEWLGEDSPIATEIIKKATVASDSSERSDEYRYGYIREALGIEGIRTYEIYAAASSVAERKTMEVDLAEAKKRASKDSGVIAQPLSLEARDGNTESFNPNDPEAPPYEGGVRLRSH